MSDEKKNPDLPPDGIVEKLDFKLEQAKKFKDQHQSDRDWET